MTSIEILDDIQHKELQIDFNVARRAFRQKLIPVVISEFHSLMFHYPIVFVKDAETGRFTCSALLGINKEAILLDSMNIENDGSMPLNIRRLPLVAIAPQDDKARPLIAANMASPGVGQGDYVFKNKSKGFDSAISALGELYDGLKKTELYIEKIIELDLISKLHAEIRNADKPAQILEGLYAIDLNKIAKISERDVAHKDKFLEISSFAYAQNFSLFNMSKLASLVA